MTAKKTILQACKEFWFPLIAASVWTVYEWSDASANDHTLTSSVKAFGAAFFFVSWLLSQWFRIRKQQKLEGDLSSIETSVKRTLAELETRTKDLSCYITGGESICFFDFLDRPNDEGHLAKMALRHNGTHPIYEISARISDIEADLAAFGPKPRFRQVYDAQKHVPLKNLAPRMVTVVPLKLELGTDVRRDFDVNFYARNGSWVQQMRFEKVAGRWLLATRVTRNNAVIYEQIPTSFPLDEQGNVSW